MPSLLTKYYLWQVIHLSVKRVKGIQTKHRQLEEVQGYSAWHLQLCVEITLCSVLFLAGIEKPAFDVFIDAFLFTYSLLFINIRRYIIRASIFKIVREVLTF